MAGRAQTVRDVIEQAFPTGFRDYERYRLELREASAGAKRKTPRSKDIVLGAPPCSAVDLFAIAGQLLLKSGAYHHVGPQVASAPTSEMIGVTEAQRAEWSKVGKAWRGEAAGLLPRPPAKLVDHWKQLISYADQPVYRTPGYTDTARKWWVHALALFCIADEAALDIGFQGPGLPSAQAQFTEFPLRCDGYDPDLRGPCP